MATSKKKRVHRCTVRVTGSDTVELFLERHEDHQATADRLEVMMENWMVFDDVRKKNLQTRLAAAEKAHDRAEVSLNRAVERVAVHLDACPVANARDSYRFSTRRTQAQREIVERARILYSASRKVREIKKDIECGYAPTQRRYIES